MEKLQNLLLLLTDEVTQIDIAVRENLEGVDSIDVLVGVDIVKDYKSKLISDIIDMNHKMGDEVESSLEIKKSLHNLMCLYSEYVDRSISLMRTIGAGNSKQVVGRLNMSNINSLLFEVLQEVRKSERKRSSSKQSQTNLISKDNRDGFEDIMLV